MFDKLVNIPFDDLRPLRDLYRKNWPTYNAGYSLLDNYRRWLQQDSDIPHLYIYSLNGDWSDGTFVIMDRNRLFGNTMSDDQSRLKTALSLANISFDFTICSIDTRTYGTIQKFIKDRELQTRIPSHTKWHYMPRDQAMKLVVEPPEGITLRRLSEEHANIANNLWPFKHPGSEVFLRRLARYNISVGAYTDTGELVAWSFRLPVGALGALQVVDSQKRKGLGSLIVRYMAKAISKTGDDVFAPVVVDNYPSRGMFEKLGFKVIDDMYWIVVPAGVLNEWKD